MANILSIDFDFFQDVDEDTIKKCYPDGIDNGTELSKILWASYYANPNTEEKINQVKILKKEFQLVKKILKFQKNKYVPVMIANSHVHIYNLIHDHFQNEEDANDFNKKINITNIDMHHDLFNDNCELDCGNWIGHIIEDYGKDNVKIQWISNPISHSLYGLDDLTELEEVKNDKELKSFLDCFYIMDCTKQLEQILSDIKDNKLNYDAIYLCRSDTWLPPHLDKYFKEMYDQIVNDYEINVLVERGIQNIRDIRDLVITEKEFYKDFTKKLK